MIKQINSQRIATWIACIGGLWIIRMGIGHFPMAYQAADSPEFASLAPHAADFLILLCLCVGITLIAFGILSIYFSRKLGSGDKSARFFFFCLATTFLIRTVIELKYPVAIPEPRPSVLVIVFLVSMIFSMALVLSFFSKPVNQR